MKPGNAAALACGIPYVERVQIRHDERVWKPFTDAVWAATGDEAFHAIGAQTRVRTMEVALEAAELGWSEAVESATDHVIRNLPEENP